MNTLPYLHRKAFTLIEIMIVVGIIAILFATFMAVVNPIAQMKKARDSTRKSNLSLIRSGVELYYADYNEYPTHTGSGAKAAYTGIECLVETLINGDADCSGSTGADSYMKIMPTDPEAGNGASYCYTTQNSQQDYVLCAKFESLDSEVPVGITSCSPTGSGAGTGDYCITNPF